jgi:hypothetical protein
LETEKALDSVEDVAGTKVAPWALVDIAFVPNVVKNYPTKRV